MIIDGYEIKPGVDLRYVNLRGANLRGADLRNADLWYANFQDAMLWDADLRGADLRNADLRYASFQDADLRGAKLNYIPGFEELLKKVADHALTEGDSLEMDEWHTCDTTHCIAGWAIHLHPEGRDLEDEYGAEVAGLLLLGHEAHSHFFDFNEDAKKYLRSVLDQA